MTKDALPWGNQPKTLAWEPLDSDFAFKGEGALARLRKRLGVVPPLELRPALGEPQAAPARDDAAPRTPTSLDHSRPRE